MPDCCVGGACSCHPSPRGMNTRGDCSSSLGLVNAKIFPSTATIASISPTERSTVSHCQLPISNLAMVVLVVGGWSPDISTALWLSSAEIYDPATAEWEEFPSTCWALQHPKVVVLRDWLVAFDRRRMEYFDNNTGGWRVVDVEGQGGLPGLCVVSSFCQKSMNSVMCFSAKPNKTLWLRSWAALDRLPMAPSSPA